MQIDTHDFNVKKFKEFLLETIETIKTLGEDDIVKFVENKLVELSSLDTVSILFLEEDVEEYEYIAPSAGKKLEFCKNKSIVKDVIEKKHPLLVKDVEKSLLYNKTCDNLYGKKIRDLLIVPIFMKKLESEFPEIIIWGATTYSSETVVTQKTVLYLIKFLDAIKSYILKINLKSLSYDLLSLEECLERSETLEYSIQRNKQYFHSIIHDIRTPMNALQGFLELLNVNETDETKKDYLDSAIKSSQHMIRLISDALDIAKIEDGSLPLEKKLFNPQIELADIIKINYESARKKSIHFGAFFDPRLPSQILSDVYRIKQVLSNLLSNAIKFTPKNGSILVELIYDEDKDVFTVAVEDTGIGISKKAQQNIFIPYVQESAETERVYGGTGLGLSISNQIVTMLGGQLDLVSEEGKGSRFFFSLPAETPENEKPFINIEKIKGQRIYLHRWTSRNGLQSDLILRYIEAFGMRYEKGTKKLDKDFTANCDVLLIEKEFLEHSEYEWVQSFLDSGKKVIWIEDLFDHDYKWLNGDIIKVAYPLISYQFANALAHQDIKRKKALSFNESSFLNVKAIVVDDNRVNVKLMEQVFKKLQMEYASFMEPEGAIDLLTEAKYDIVFMDENMPQMLGSKAIEIIRQKEKEGKIHPLILVSLSGDTDHKEEIIAAGADEIMTKPIDLNDLTKILNKYFK